MTASDAEDNNDNTVEDNNDNVHHEGNTADGEMGAKEMMDIPSMTSKQFESLVRQRTAERRKKLIEKFVDALTLHGYAQFHVASGFRKVLWAVILGTMAIFFMGLTYLSYYSDGYYATVKSFDVEKHNEVEFPTVTICNYNPVFKKGMWDRIGLSEKEFMYFYFTVLSNRGNYMGVRTNDAVTQSIIDKLKKQGLTKYSDILKKFEINEMTDIHDEMIDQTLKYQACVFETEQCNITHHFRPVFRNVDQSVCLQYNSYKTNGSGITSLKTNMEGGLQMLYNIDGEMYHYKSHGLRGLLVEIHHHGDPQHLIDYNNFVTLEPGVFTTIELEKTKTTYKPLPFHPNCGHIHYKILKDDRKVIPYSRAMCQVDCLLRLTLERCGCVGDQFMEYIEHKKVRVCNITEMACTFQVPVPLIHQTCHNCPIECEATEYKMKTSRMSIGNSMIYEEIMKMKNWTRLETESWVRENIVGFRIGFGTLNTIKQMYQEKVRWYERISMVGGSIGLLLGFSFITACELLFFIFDWISTPMYIRNSRKHLRDHKSFIRKAKKPAATKEPKETENLVPKENDVEAVPLEAAKDV